MSGAAIVRIQVGERAVAVKPDPLARRPFWRGVELGRRRMFPPPNLWPGARDSHVDDLGGAAAAVFGSRTKVSLDALAAAHLVRRKQA